MLIDNKNLIDPHIQWEYITIDISKDDDITEYLNQFGKNGWECFHIDVTAFGSTAYMKRINYLVMERKKLEIITETTNRTIEEVMKLNFFK